MEYAVECLKKERELLLSAIKNGESDKVKEKVEIDHAISWLEKITKYDLPESKKCNFIKLPDADMGFYSYRIMNDCESEDREDWIELKNENGDPVSLILDDFLIKIRYT